MYLLRDHPPAIWPTKFGWHALLRGVSWKLGLDPTKSILFHLANRSVATCKVPPALAYEYVVDLLVAHVGELCVEFGLPHNQTVAICDLLQPWLDSLCIGADDPMPPSWASRREWLAIDRGGAARVGFSPRRTLSTTLANIVANRGRYGIAKAKRLVHARIALHARQLAIQVGFSPLQAWAIERHLRRALDSFELV